MRLAEAAEKFTSLVPQRYGPLTCPEPLGPSFWLSALSFQLVLIVSHPFALRWFQTPLCSSAVR